jgi:multidrug resistance efflux pump
MKRILLLILPLLAACGPRYGLRVPDDTVKKLPYETRIELLEAENDLALAIDKLDQASSEILRARDNIRRARSRAQAAKEELNRAEDTVSREVAQLTIEEANARVEYLRARQRLNVALQEVEQLALRCAFARFELARVKAARKAKVEGSEELDPKKFEAQVTGCEAAVKEERAELGTNTANEKAAREAWEAKKAALAKKTFDARTSPYVENL